MAGRPGSTTAPLSHRARAFRLFAQRVPGRRKMSGAHPRRRHRRPFGAGGGDRVRHLRPLAVLRGQVPVLRLQQPCAPPGAGRAALRRGAGARASRISPRSLRHGTVTSVFFGGGTPSLMRPATVGDRARRDRRPLAGRGGSGDHAGGQSGERRGRPLPRLSRRRRQPPVARRAVARRCRAEGARAHPRCGGGAPRRGDGARDLPAPLLRSHLCAAGADACAPGAAELEAAIALAADHLSLYQLTIEAGTPFQRLHAAGKLAHPRSGARRGILLVDAGGRPRRTASPAYEISNHAVARRGIAP